MSTREYEAVIGLEMHVQLRTRTKMFCGCELSFGDDPNTHTCPVCLGHPGSLPVVNERAVEYGLMIGLALGCEIAPSSIFHRKNYFYPDLPKGYQISQYDIPLASGGRLGEVRIHRVHLEEDAAKLVHAGESGRIHGSEASLVDFNRGGTPLVEIVTEPDLRSAEEAADFGRLLQATIRQMGVSDAHMEEGSLRADANVSIRPAGEATFGTKTELKNMNSWSFLRRGIQAELARQEEILAGGGEVEQETLHFDPQTGTLSPLRSKEEAHDYRYFPEPDLVPLAPTEAMLARAREAIPELPAERAERFESELGLPEETARVLAHRFELGDFYEQAVSANSDAEGGAVRAEGEGAADPKTLANWVKNELVPRLGDADPGEWKVDPGALARLVALVGEKAVSQSAAKDVLDTLVAEGGDPQAIVEAKGLTKAGGDELAEVVDRALEGNPDIVEKLKADPGDKSIGAIVGAVMRETKGRADGGEVQRLIRERIA